MSTKKPWRTVITGTSTGRFTREQIRDAIDSVSSKSKVGEPKPKGDGGASKSMSGSALSKKSGTVTARAAKSGGTLQKKSTGGEGQTAGSSACGVAPKNGGAAASKNGKPAKPRKDPLE